MAGLLSPWLPSLEIPQTARLVAIETGVDATGAATWTITFRDEPTHQPDPAEQAASELSDLDLVPPPTPPSADGGGAAAPPGILRSSSHPPRPPPLSAQQVAGGAVQPGAPHAMVLPSPAAAGPSSLNSPASAAASSAFSPDSPGAPAAFPTLPSQAGATNRLFPLRCTVMTYAWGHRGDGSIVGRLAAANDPEFTIASNTPYAEMWMGTHPNGPSMVLIQMPWRTVTPLNEWLKLNPSMQGRRQALAQQSNSLGRRRARASRERHELPFLFKVLSVRTALSIQAHPDKAVAGRLHANRPDLYKDDNHKPEMALAVTRFEALCSFQKATYVLENCRACPELVLVVGEAAVSELAAAVELAAPLTPVLPALPAASSRADELAAAEDGDANAARHGVIRPALQRLFTSLMRADGPLVQRQLDALMRRISRTNEMLRTPVDELAVRLHEQYPGDVGVFCVYLLNYHALAPGEALFCGANEPHAYISGECVECMAASDNVVRAGLTPKFKDVDTLTSMLNYNDGPPHLIQGEEIGPHVLRYVTPVDEFQVDRAVLPAHGQATLPSTTGVSIVLVLSGSGTLEELSSEDGIGAAGLQHSVESGAVFVASADTFMLLRALDQPMVVFRASEKCHR